MAKPVVLVAVCQHIFLDMPLTSLFLLGDESEDHVGLEVVKGKACKTWFVHSFLLCILPCLCVIQWHLHC